MLGDPRPAPHPCGGRGPAAVCGARPLLQASSVSPQLEPPPGPRGGAAAQVSARRPPAVWVPAEWGARGEGPLGPEVASQRQSWGVKGQTRSNPLRSGRHGDLELLGTQNLPHPPPTTHCLLFPVRPASGLGPDQPRWLEGGSGRIAGGLRAEPVRFWGVLQFTTPGHPCCLGLCATIGEV